MKPETAEVLAHELEQLERGLAELDSAIAEYERFVVKYRSEREAVVAKCDAIRSDLGSVPVGAS